VDRLVIDASVVIASLLPDEPYRAVSLRILKGFLSGNLELLAIPLLRFEITNALWKAISRGRTKLSDAQAALREFEAFNLPEREVATQEILRIAHTYNRSAYDAAYLAMKDRSRLVLWVEDFK
jgi:predicted nucleic acid-binding protein